MENDRVDLILALEQELQELQEKSTILQQRINDLRNHNYDDMVGKYYQISASCVFKVNSILCADDGDVIAEGIAIEGHIEYTRSLEIAFRYTHEFISGYLPKEITSKEFYEFYLQQSENFHQKLKTFID